MSKSPAQLLLALLCVVLVAAACGGDDDDTSTGVEDTDDLAEETDDGIDDAADTTEDLAEDTADTAEDTAEDLAEDAADAIDDAGDTAEDLAEDAADTAEDFVQEQRENLEDAIDEQGGGGATLSVGGETYTFDSVVCAFGPEEIGQEGAELVVTGISDGLQLYVSIDSFGHSVDLQDIDDFENPRVSLGATPFNNGEEFIQVDGKDVTADASFIDDVAGGTEVDGTLEATCP